MKEGEAERGRPPGDQSLHRHSGLGQHAAFYPAHCTGAETGGPHTVYRAHAYSSSEREQRRQGGCTSFQGVTEAGGAGSSGVQTRGEAKPYSKVEPVVTQGSIKRPEIGL